MKYCPKCQNNYTDETLQFCLQDGTQLISQSSEKTDMPTVSFEGDETIISNKKREPITFELSDSEQRNWEHSQATQTSAIQPAQKSSNTLIAVLLTVLVMLVLFGFLSIGAWYYFNNQNQIAQNPGFKGGNSNTESGMDVNQNTIPTEKTTPKPTRKKTPKPTPKSTPDQNPEETKKNISSRINIWKSNAEAMNLDAYMNNYASKIDYYNRRGASKSFVKKDKQKAFGKYDSMKVQLSNINIKPSVDGQTATAIFDKEWNFTSEESNNSGKVQQQLRLKKNGDAWEITAEKDLKVYYVNK